MSSKTDQTMRIGVLTDLHCELSPTRARRWINQYEPNHLEARLREAGKRFAQEQVAAVLLLGDSTETADPAAFDHVLTWLKSAGHTVAAVGGNHDWEPSGALEKVAARHSVLLAGHRPLIVDGLEIAGVEIEPQNGDRSVFHTAGFEVASRSLIILASHFPVVALADRLAAARLPFPGDITDRHQVAANLARYGVPVVVLSGHIHTRLSEESGRILQLTFGAMIEPPFDMAIVEINSGQQTVGVARWCYRLGPKAAVDPVLAPEHEAWSWKSGRWFAHGGRRSRRSVNVGVM
jgi:predicted phosphodiesterase